MDRLLSLAGAQPLVNLVRAAGEAILAVYHGAAPVALVAKADDSPLTAADLAAHECLVAGLPGILDVPIISEEAPLPALHERSKWPCYWLVDPLDGTKEFLHRNGEFTVNIALIENGRPVLGVVHVPVTGITYLGVNSLDSAPPAAWKIVPGLDPLSLAVRKLEQSQPLRVLVSHRQRSELQDLLLQSLGNLRAAGVEILHAGSSLKFCLIAEGAADFYPRFGSTSEWDTAAAQAVLEAAGGAIIAANPDLQSDWQPLSYNQRESLLNPWFYALGDSDFDWQVLLHTAFRKKM